MNSEKLKDVKKLCQKNELLREFFSEYEEIIKSPYFEGYTTLKAQIMIWQKSIKENNIGITGNGEDKSFERAHKFLSELKPYYELIEYLKKQMTPEEVKSAEEQADTLVERALESSGR